MVHSDYCIYDVLDCFDKEKEIGLKCCESHFDNKNEESDEEKKKSIEHNI